MLKQTRRSVGAGAVKTLECRRIPLGAAGAINGAVGGQPASLHEERAALTASQAAGEGASKLPKTLPTVLHRRRTGEGDRSGAGEDGSAPPAPGPDLASRDMAGSPRPRKVIRLKRIYNF
jgi:hypothetical protein